MLARPKQDDIDAVAVKARGPPHPARSLRRGSGYQGLERVAFPTGDVPEDKGLRVTDD